MTEFPEAAIEGPYDAVVCGGGPAGTTFATLLARGGFRTLVLERERFPRFHVGESLLPWNIPLFDRLGLLEKIQTQGLDGGAQVKMGARFYNQGSEHQRIVRFANALDSNYPSAFQVKRAWFDKLLLDNARQAGAVVVEGARVEEVVFDARSRATGVRVRLWGETTSKTIGARLVVDATGRDALLSRHFGGRERDPLLERSAAFAHFDTFKRAEGPEGGDIVVFTTADGWWWFIPFSDGSVSVGIVMPSRRFRERSATVEGLFDGLVAKTPEVADLLDGAKRTTEVHAIADYSYKTGKIAGDGFCALGDAACFLDPVFSSGVLLAMRSAELAADAAAKALSAKGRVDARDFARFERRFGKAVGTFRTFVHGFYRPDLLETFYTKAPNPAIERAVTRVLGGGVFDTTLKARFCTFLFHVCVKLMWVQQRMRGEGVFARVRTASALPTAAASRP